MAIRSLYLGRLGVPTLIGPAVEAVGDTIQSDDSGVALARRRPRMFTLQVPLYGIEADAYTAGPRMRRQMRAMIQNEQLRLGGLYFQWTVDPDMDGWLVPGGGQITDQDLGGITLGSWRLELDSALRVATLRTHRPARRVELYDRILNTTPRDYRGMVLCTDFASLRGSVSVGSGSGGPYWSNGQPTFLPVHANDGLGQYRTPVVLYARTGIDGTGWFAVGMQHAQVVNFEHTEPDMRKGDVVIWDRQGVTAPVQTLAGDTNPQDPVNGYGWEEVYGPDQPLTTADCVVVANSLCRVRYVGATNSFAVDQYQAGVGYVEQGRVTIWESAALDAYAQHINTGLILGNNSAIATVLEYSFERAVIRISSLGPHCRIDTIITLQRGWLGPRFEAYAACFDGTTTTPGAQLRYTPNQIGVLALAEAGPAAGQVFMGGDPLFGWAQSPGATFATLGEPWVYIQNRAYVAALPGVVVSTPQSLARSPSYVDNTAYGGGNRPSTAVSARFGETQVGGQAVYGYVHMQLAFTAWADNAAWLGEFDAVTYVTANAGITHPSDAGNNPVAATVIQSTNTASGTTAFLTAALAAAQVPFGRYAIFARVRVASSGAGAADGLTCVGGFTGSLIADGAATRTSSTSYTWLYLGESVHANAADTLSFQLYRQTGAQATPKFMLDQLLLVPVERRIAGNVTHDGARDLGGLVLYDAQAVPTYVER